MNARSYVFEFSVEGRQVQEVVSSIFHTLLFHRTLGKFFYKREESYSVGTVGFEEVPCDYVDLTYVRTSSDELAINVGKEVNSFCDALRNKEGPYSGQISLEFYQKKRSRWLFATESIPWEVWTLKVHVISLANEQQRQVYRAKVGEMLAEKIMFIAHAINRNDYIPKMPTQSDLDLIFDTSYSDIQPFLFKLTHETSGPTNPSVGTAVRNLLRGSLTF